MFACHGQVMHTSPPTSDSSSFRRAEQHVALGRLGLGRCEVRRCGLPDGHLDRHENKLADTLTSCSTTHLVSRHLGPRRAP